MNQCGACSDREQVLKDRVRDLEYTLSRLKGTIHYMIDDKSTKIHCLRVITNIIDE